MACLASSRSTAPYPFRRPVGVFAQFLKGCFAIEALASERKHIQAYVAGRLQNTRNIMVAIDPRNVGIQTLGHPQPQGNFFPPKR